jgi:hypothetical protein
VCTDAILQEFAGAAGLLHRNKFLEDQLDESRRVCNVFLLRLRRQERRLFLIRQAFALQHITDPYLDEYRARLFEVAKIPTHGSDEPYQELGWLLKNCKSVEECRRRLGQITDLDDLVLQPSEDVVARLGEENAALASQVVVLKQTVASLGERPRDQFVSQHVYDMLRSNMAVVQMQRDALEKEKTLDTKDFVLACKVRMMAYWDRENRILEDVAFKEIDNRNLKKVLAMVASERKLPAVKATNLELGSKVQELSVALKVEFINLMTNARTFHMDKLKDHVETLEHMKNRKNALIENQHVEILQLERACGMTRKEATASDVGAAQKEYNRICGSIRAVKDNEEMEKQKSNSVLATFRKQVADLQGIASEIRREESKLNMTKVELARVLADCTTTRECVDARMGQISRLNEKIAEIKSGADGDLIRKSVDRATKAEQHAKMMEAAVLHSNQQQVEIHEAILELEAEKKTLEKDVAGLQAERRRLATPPDVVMAST